ncbi:MAG: MATE family efflux transporter [Planctomycetes bacterium]|nr:MATE family efflux transporter [Planctomycetota bacterium]
MAKSKEQIPPASKSARPHADTLRTHISQVDGVGLAIVALALPVLGEQFCNILVGLVDTFLAGRFLDKEAITAVGIASYVSWLATMLSGFIGVGSTALVARAVGAGDSAQANRLANQSMGLAGFLGFAMMVGLLILSTFLPRMLGLPSEAAGMTAQYLRIDAFGQFLYAYMLIGAACLRGAGDTRTPMLIMIGVNFVNVVVSVTLCLGLGPFPALGVIGIAAGTVAARSLGGVVMLIVLYKGQTALKLNLPQMAFDRKIARRIVNIGGPAGLDAALMWTGHFIFLGFLMKVDADAEIGLAASAAHMIGVRIESFSYLPAMAWGIAAATLVGQALGAGDPQRARRIGHLAVLQLAPYALVVTGLYYFCAEFIYSFATGDRMVQDQGVPALRLVAFAQPSLICMIIYVSALRGAGDTRFPMLMNVLGIFCVRIPLAYTFGVVLKGGLFGAWIGMTSDLIFRSLLAAARFKWGKWTGKEI